MEGNWPDRTVTGLFVSLTAIPRPSPLRAASEDTASEAMRASRTILVRVPRRSPFLLVESYAPGF